MKVRCIDERGMSHDLTLGKEYEVFEEVKEDKMFDWDRFEKGGIAVHCDTEEKAKDFLNKCDKQGIKWVHGGKSTHQINYEAYNDATCYHAGKGGLTYCDVSYFKSKGIEIIKWEIKETKKKTFREVIATIKEGEVWVNDIAPISFIRLREDGVLDFNKNEGINLFCTYTLQRKEYTFQEAFKAYEEGKEIESVCSGYRYKKENGEDISILAADWQEFDYFELYEIRGKWYIN